MTASTCGAHDAYRQGGCESTGTGPTRFASMSLPLDDEKLALLRAIERRILTGPGMAPSELRTKAFADSDLPEPLASLVDKVAKRSFRVTDADFAAAVAAGFTQDQPGLVDPRPAPGGQGRYS